MKINSKLLMMQLQQGKRVARRGRGKLVLLMTTAAKARIALHKRHGSFSYRCEHSADYEMLQTFRWRKIEHQKELVEMHNAREGNMRAAVDFLEE